MAFKAVLVGRWQILFFSSTLGELWRWDRVGSKSPVKVESIVQDSAGKQPLREAGSHDANVALGLFAFGVNSQLPKRITRRNLADDYDELPPPEIVLWNLKTMQRLVTLTGHRGQINAVALSPDGQTLVSGGTDGTIRFWNPASLQPR